MIDLYSWATPNGHKIHIMLEETGLPYRIHPINIRIGDQFKPEFLAVSPNNRIPAIMDPDGPDGKPLSLFESGAILIYLAAKTGKFLPDGLHDRYKTLEWLMWQMGGVGPMFGQANHFRGYAVEKLGYAIDRYTKESNRLTGVLDKRLEQYEFVACDEFTIADMAIFPWMRGAERRGIDMNEYQNVKRWFAVVESRPAVQRALKVLAAEGAAAPIDDRAREVMFGATQFQRH